MNKIVLSGRITAAPELKVTTDGTEVTSFCIAVDRGYKDHDGNRVTDFINVTAWRKTAAFVCQYFDKGDGISLEGRLESRKYVDKDGNNRTAFEVNANSVEFPPSRKSETKQNPDPMMKFAESRNVSASSSGSSADDDLPF